MVVVYENIIPLSLFFKKDKNYGENVSWQTQKSMIIEEYNLATQDIQNKKYISY